jgi:hypothetical protein
MAKYSACDGPLGALRRAGARPSNRHARRNRLRGPMQAVPGVARDEVE